MIYRVLLALTTGICAAWSLQALREREEAPVETLPGYREGKDVRNRSIFQSEHGWMVFALFAFTLWSDRTRVTGIRLFWSITMELLILLSLYCVLLLAILPALRRCITSRTCGRLWELPVLLTGSVLYLETVQLSWWSHLPKLVFYVPKRVLIGFTTVWLIGFTVTLIWYLTGHFRFKKQLERGACPADARILRVWGEELAKVGIAQTTPLWIQPEIQTPLVVGVREKALAAYLPDRFYTEQDLRLIFQHELRHVFRRDAEIKLAWAIIRSLLWFHPLAWIATQKAAEDLELSCDAFVLKDADEETRRRYAELLLDSAGDGRGFTTCLSSKAKTLRYRLNCAVKPGKRLNGGLVLAAMVFAMLMGSGAVSFAHQKGPLETFHQISRYDEIANTSHYINEASIFSAIHTREQGYYSQQYAEELHQYLSSLDVTLVTKPFFSAVTDKLGEGEYAWIQLQDPVTEKRLNLYLWKDWLIIGQIAPHHDVYYKVQGGINWEFLRSMMVLV